MKQRRFTALSLSLSLLLAGAAVAQLPVGWRDVALPNKGTSGSGTLLARIVYPGVTPGENVPVLPQAGGRPVVVFLHGIGSIGQNYVELYTVLAQSGYVAVMVDTAITDGSLLFQDAVALFPTLTQENLNASSPFHGALDMSRAAVQGYSMGGGSAMRVLQSNPGYRCGFIHAGSYWASDLASVRVPFGCVHGLGDTVVSPGNPSSYVANTPNFTGVKFAYIFNSDATHSNIATSYLRSPADVGVWNRVVSIFLGLFDAVLKGDANGYERCVGLSARSDPRFVASEFRLAVQQPALWLSGSGQLGSPFTMTELAEPGTIFWLMAAGRSWIPTPLGTFYLDPASLILLPSPPLDPATRIANRTYAVPALPILVGLRLSFQAFGNGVGMGTRLTGVADLPVVP